MKTLNSILLSTLCWLALHDGAFCQTGSKPSLLFEQNVHGGEFFSIPVIQHKSETGGSAIYALIANSLLDAAKDVTAALKISATLQPAMAENSQEMWQLYISYKLYSTKDESRVLSGIVEGYGKYYLFPVKEKERVFMQINPAEELNSSSMSLFTIKRQGESGEDETLFEIPLILSNEKDEVMNVLSSSGFSDDELIFNIVSYE